MKNLKKLIYLLLACGIFACTEPAVTSPPAATTPKPQVKPPEIIMNTDPSLVKTPVNPPVKEPKVNTTSNSAPPTPSPMDAQPKPKSVDQQKGQVQVAADPDLDSKKAEIASKLQSMGNVDVGDIKIVKNPERPDVPKLNDVQKEKLYNETTQKQMGAVLKIVGAQYRAGKLAQRLNKTPSGLEYLKVQKGKGRMAINDSFVAFKSVGATLDGNVFEQNLEKDRAHRIKIGKNDLIPGLEEGIKTMRAGDSAIFFVPPSLAYGERGRLGVPPNTMVVYSVILESVN